MDSNRKHIISERNSLTTNLSAHAKTANMLKQQSKLSVWRRPQEYLLGHFSPIIKASLLEFVLSKIQCSQHILLNIFKRIYLNYGHYYLRSIFFYTLKLYSGTWLKLTDANIFNYILIYIQLYLIVFNCI